MDATMNGEGARVEQRGGKPIFAQFHAIASGTTAAGAVIGGWLAFEGYAWIAAFFAEAALLAAAALVARAIVEGPTDAARLRGAPSLKAIDLGLAALGLAVGVSIVCETSALAWGALLLRKTAPSLAAYAGLGATFFAGCQSAMRFQIDRLRHAVEDRTLMLASYAVSGGGAGAGRRRSGLRRQRLRLRRARRRHRRHRALRLLARGAAAGAFGGAGDFGGLVLRPVPARAGAAADRARSPTPCRCRRRFSALAVCMLLAMIGVAVFVPRAPRAFTKPLASGGLAE